MGAGLRGRDPAAERSAQGSHSDRCWAGEFGAFAYIRKGDPQLPQTHTCSGSRRCRTQSSFLLTARLQRPTRPPSPHTGLCPSIVTATCPSSSTGGWTLSRLCRAQQDPILPGVSTTHPRQVLHPCVMRGVGGESPASGLGCAKVFSWWPLLPLPWGRCRAGLSYCLPTPTSWLLDPSLTSPLRSVPHFSSRHLAHGKVRVPYATEGTSDPWGLS